MDRDEFEALVESRRIAGQSELGAAMRILVEESGQVDRELDALPYSAFLEPRLFSHFSRPANSQPPLSQLLHGYFPPEDRCVTLVQSDSFGAVCIPHSGWLLTEARNARLELHETSGTQSLSLAGGPAGALPFRWLPVSIVPGTHTELTLVGDPWLRSWFQPTAPDRLDTFFVADPARYERIIVQGLKAIESVTESFFWQLLDTLRCIVLFDQPDARSFAALGAHGAVFLKVPPSEHPGYFIEELTHQGGHLVFNAATVRRREFTKLDPDTSLSSVYEDDARTVYDALHGLYTEHMTVRVLRGVDESKPLVGEAAAEVYGRLCFVSARHRQDIDYFSDKASAVFSDLGLELFEYFREQQELFEKERPDLQDADLTGQGYDFNLGTYLRRNYYRVLAV